MGAPAGGPRCINAALVQISDEGLDCLADWGLRSYAETISEMGRASLQDYLNSALPADVHSAFDHAVSGVVSEPELILLREHYDELHRRLTLDKGDRGELLLRRIVPRVELDEEPPSGTYGRTMYELRRYFRGEELRSQLLQEIDKPEFFGDRDVQRPGFDEIGLERKLRYAMERLLKGDASSEQVFLLRRFRDTVPEGFEGFKSLSARLPGFDLSFFIPGAVPQGTEPGAMRAAIRRVENAKKFEFSVPNAEASRVLFLGGTKVDRFRITPKFEISGDEITMSLELSEFQMRIEELTTFARNDFSRVLDTYRIGVKVLPEDEGGPKTLKASVRLRREPGTNLSFRRIEDGEAAQVLSFDEHNAFGLDCPTEVDFNAEGQVVGTDSRFQFFSYDENGQAVELGGSTSPSGTGELVGLLNAYVCENVNQTFKQVMTSTEEVDGETLFLEQKLSRYLNQLIKTHITRTFDFGGLSFDLPRLEASLRIAEAELAKQFEAGKNRLYRIRVRRAEAERRSQKRRVNRQFLREFTTMDEHLKQTLGYVQRSEQGSALRDSVRIWVKEARSYIEDYGESISRDQFDGHERPVEAFNQRYTEIVRAIIETRPKEDFDVTPTGLERAYRRLVLGTTAVDLERYLFLDRPRTIVELRPSPMGLAYAYNPQRGVRPIEDLEVIADRFIDKISIPETQQRLREGLNPDDQGNLLAGVGFHGFVSEILQLIAKMKTAFEARGQQASQRYVDLQKLEVTYDQILFELNRKKDILRTRETTLGVLPETVQVLQNGFKAGLHSPGLACYGGDDFHQPDSYEPDYAFKVGLNLDLVRNYLADSFRRGEISGCANIEAQPGVDSPCNKQDLGFDHVSFELTDQPKVAWDPKAKRLSIDLSGLVLDNVRKSCINIENTAVPTMVNLDLKIIDGKMRWELDEDEIYEVRKPEHVRCGQIPLGWFRGFFRKIIKEAVAKEVGQFVEQFQAQTSRLLDFQNTYADVLRDLGVKEIPRLQVQSFGNDPLGPIVYFSCPRPGDPNSLPEVRKPGPKVLKRVICWKFGEQQRELLDDGWVFDYNPGEGERVAKHYLHGTHLDPLNMDRPNYDAYHVLKPAEFDGDVVTIQLAHLAQSDKYSPYRMFQLNTKTGDATLLFRQRQPMAKFSCITEVAQ